ncbi:DNA helicase [Dickeya fangzhongdai]|uniref:AAA domain-containing protein n=1 Tax=Dickeya fangzhongdai TaxID=1778540 RepID=UPI0005735B39|nr:AAA domain-containing protein [Dickeya fangzhongdai]KHN56834.1 DNA helicase [Dickeya fangzhongdai]
MDSNTQGFTSYWRNSLADAESGKGSFERKDADSFTRWMDITTGRLDEEVVRTFFEDEDDAVKTVEVLLRPQAWFRLLKHGKERIAGAPGIVTPLVTSALLNREGFLFPTAPATIPRDLLEPLPKGTFSIGEMAQYDKYKTTHNSTTFCANDEQECRSETDEQQAERHARYQQLWQKYLKESGDLLTNVAGKWIDTHEQYESAGYGYVIKAKQPGGASKHILPMYDHLLTCKKVVPLLTRFASEDMPSIEPLLASNAKFSERLGHSGDKFPLAMAQRDALSHYLTQQSGDILAVNGPPGTGKTTLLLSIIATEWARAALNKTEPPVVIATSTNNQAVTNIIEAFGKDFASGTGAMAGRWLPELKSYGAYFPSAGRRRDDAEKKYQTDNFFNRVESLEYVEDAQVFYLEKARAAFPEDECGSPERVVDLLHKRLTGQATQLRQIEPAWERLNCIRQERCTISEDLDQYIQDKSTLLLNSTNKISLLIQGKKQWHQYRANESIAYAFFSWIPVVRTKRHYQMNLFLDATFGTKMASFQDTLPEGVDAYIDGLIAQEQKDQAEYQQQIDLAQDVSRRESEAAQRWRELTQSLGHTGEEELSLAGADELADTQIRFPTFLLATHYWEGRWLMDMAAIGDLQKEKGLKGARTIKARWQRRMKLTPCVVMTCYMLPHHLAIREHVGGKKFDDSYLYNFADLLIVDEAGQVLPEVAAASFALAKKALVIGDTEQIAPIWNSLPGIDIGNMVEENILTGGTQEELTDAYALVCDSGKSTASGSVMKVAQFNSRYQYDPLARGMYLYEHRRCFDNIIDYCNVLCYHGKLQPKRGIEKGTIFPAMGYLHIDGKGMQANGGSRYNTFEAETIATWLVTHKEEIEHHYGEPLHKVVGVVTPFSAQVSAIKVSLRKLGINCSGDEHSLTVGTVHSLQGAERAIVLFSPVYSKHEDGGFIDSDSSMLNVAVSRAKDSFLVFGDMDLFEIQPGSSPRGLLAKYLFASDCNALQFEFKERQDLSSAQTEISTLHGVEQHDVFLNQTFEAIGKSITIVSPWLTWQKLEQTGFLVSMAQARSRGIAITVVTDKCFNTEHADYEKRKEKQQRLNDAVEKLGEMGIVTKLVNRVHSKIVIGDEELLCVGSFNWFSAARDEKYQRYDTSMVYRGESLKGEIKTIYTSLEQREL